MKKTIVINLFGAPGAGKSQTMAGIFSQLKAHGIDCEQAPEFVKEMVWADRMDETRDQTYIFAKQNHRLFRLNGRVDIIITDAPLLQSLYYGKDDAEFVRFVKHTASGYTNFNYFLNRIKAYNPNGRYQTEEESDALGKKLRSILIENEVHFEELDGGQTAIDIIVDKILSGENI